MEYGAITTEWVDDTWGSVSVREDLDGTKSIIFTPDRQIKNDGDGDGSGIEIIMTEQQANLVARGLRRATRRAKVT